MIGQDTKAINKVKKAVITFRHDLFPNEVLYCCPRFAKVTEEGPASKFFACDVPAKESQGQGGGGGDKEQEKDKSNNKAGVDIPKMAFNMTGTREDIQLMRGMGFDVDDDNEPAIENILTTEQEEVQEEKAKWEWDGLCMRKSKNFHNSNPSLNGVNEFSISSMTYSSMFLLLFPMAFVQNVMLPKMNEALEGGFIITYGEFLRFLGLCFFMATCSGFSRGDCFSTTEINCRSGAPYRLTCWMSANRFNQILDSLQYTNCEKPTFKDRFWEVRQLIGEWNRHIQDVFKSSFVACLDESMSI